MASLVAKAMYGVLEFVYGNYFQMVKHLIFQ